MILKDYNIFFIFLLGAILSKSLIFPGIALGDLLLLIGVLILITFYSNKLKIGLYEISVSILILLTSIIFIFSETGSYFSINEFMKSYVKLIFYLICFILFSSFLKIIETKKIITIIFYTSLINAILALLIYAMQNINLDINFYHFLWFGLEEPGKIATDVNHWQMSNSTLIRLRGIFAEPSLYGIYQTISIALIFLNYSRILINNKIAFSLILISIIFTFSISTYAIMTFLFFVLLIKKNTRNSLKDLIVFNAFAIVIGIIIFFVFVSSFTFIDVFYERVMQRIFDFFDGFERSGVQRINQSYVTAIVGLENSILFGSGLGNIAQLFEATEYKTMYITGIDEIQYYSARSHVVPYAILGELGILGIVLFSLLLFQYMKYDNIYIYSFYIIYLFSTGTYLDSSFWIFFSMIRFADRLGNIKNREINSNEKKY
tara:strand:- start:14279 stop:15574 length:1296 start_codon:yes stop_codon:yes gene_type:complete